MKYIFLLILFSFSFIYCDEAELNYEIPHMVHFQDGRIFTVEFIEFIGRQKDILPNGRFAKEEADWIENRPRFGDTVLIKELEKEHLSGGSYRYVALLKNLRNNKEEYFQSRVVNTSKSIKIAKYLGYKSRIDDHNRTIQLEDGEILKVMVSPLERPKVRVTETGFDHSESDKIEKIIRKFKFQPDDVIEIDEQPHFYNMKVYREGKLLPYKFYASSQFSRKPFPQPSNNRFYASFNDFKELGLFGIYSKFGYDILSPKNYNKANSWWTFNYLHDDVLHFVDEKGSEINIKFRIPEPFRGPIRM